ncbi:glycerate kinase [Vibrio profundi]|uniref:glycerate kinase n=1 Tax=Vibrio profundi TaxID=1774960 RepID=UPI003736119E
MKVVIAPDSFKESLSAKQVCDAIRSGLQRVWPEAEFVSVPVADGGEGTVQSLVDATKGHLTHIQVQGPQNKPVEAFYGVLGDNNTAVIEMAAASGLHHVPVEQRDPKTTTSFGTGQLIKHALDSGMKRLIIGLGGSATNDGGIGMLAALGAEFNDANQQALAPIGGSLAQLDSINLDKFDDRLKHCEILVACDVDNPLCGLQGATSVFGPQKGATASDIRLLDDALRHFGHLTESITGVSVLDTAGAGAAGGMGAALLAYTGAQLKPGIDIVLDTVNLKETVQNADIVITGEGRIDSQTIFGKTPVGVAKVAKQYHLPVVALSGCTGDGYQAVYDHGIDAVFSAVPRAMSLADAMRETDFNLADLAENAARLINLHR